MKANKIPVVVAAVIFFGVAAAGEVRGQAPATSTSTTRETGTVAAFHPSSIAIRLGDSEKAVRYSASAATIFMDENGAAVPPAMLKTGVPVAVDFVQRKGRLVACKVMVLRSLTPGPAIVGSKTPIMTAAVEDN